MSDDLVKRARHNALSDMPHYASVELIEALADRIEELQQERGEALNQLDSARHSVAVLEKRVKTFSDGWGVADKGRIEAEAKLAKAVEALTVIDALDPAGLIDGCSHSAIRGLVLRMGETSRTTLAELTGEK